MLKPDCLNHVYKNSCFHKKSCCWYETTCYNTWLITVTAVYWVRYRPSLSVHMFTSNCGFFRCGQASRQTYSTGLQKATICSILSLSCPSVRRWRCSTRFLVSAHEAPQSKGWGANMAAYCTGGSLLCCRWMWLVALLVPARTLCYCHINMLLFKGYQPPVANCTPFSIPGQFLKSVERDPAFT